MQDRSRKHRSTYPPGGSVKNAKKRATARSGTAKAVAAKQSGKTRSLAVNAKTGDRRPKKVDRKRPGPGKKAAARPEPAAPVFDQHRIPDAASLFRTSPERLLMLAQSADPAVRAAVASSGRAPQAAQELLARDPDVEVRRSMVRYAGRELGSLFLDDPDDVVRGFAVWTAPANRLPALAEDPSPLVRGRVAEHEAVTVELLRGLAADEDSDVREMVAGGRRTPWGLLGQLSVDPDDTVRRIASRELERGARLCDCCGLDHAAAAQSGNSAIEADVASRPGVRAPARR